MTRGSKNETVPSSDSCAGISDDAICILVNDAGRDAQASMFAYHIDNQSAHFVYALDADSIGNVRQVEREIR